MSIPLHNITEEEAWKPTTMLPVGWHDVSIVEVEERQSSGGNPAIGMRFEDAGGDGINDQLVITTNTYGKVLQLLQAVNIQPQGGDWEFDPSVLHGRRLSIRVVEKPGRDDPSKQFKEVAAYDATRGQQGSDAPADTSGFATNGAQQADDDIPF